MMFEMVGGMTFDVHGITGVVVIVPMFIHAVWAFVVLRRKDEKAIHNFHKCRSLGNLADPVFGPDVFCDGRMI